MKRYVDFDDHRVNSVQKMTLSVMKFAEMNDLKSMKTKFKNHDFINMKIKPDLLLIKNIWNFIYDGFWKLAS